MCVCESVSVFSGQKLPKVNKELALKLMEEGDEEAGLASRKKKGKVGEQWLQAESSETTRDAQNNHLSALLWFYCVLNSTSPTLLPADFRCVTSCVLRVELWCIFLRTSLIL